MDKLEKDLLFFYNFFKEMLATLLNMMQFYLLVMVALEQFINS